MLAIEIRRQGIGLQHHRQRHPLTSYTKGLFIDDAGHTPEAWRTEPRPAFPFFGKFYACRAWSCHCALFHGSIHGKDFVAIATMAYQVGGNPVGTVEPETGWGVFALCDRQITWIHRRSSVASAYRTRAIAVTRSAVRQRLEAWQTSRR